MAQNIVTIEDLQEFRLQRLNDLRELMEKQRNTTERTWLRSAEVRKLLRVSHGTLQNLRINGELPYKKLGGIIFYKLEDIQKALG